jgi:hypothetical protein
MPLYEYIDEANDEIVEIFLHHDEADDIGAIRNHDGRRLRRILSQIVSKVDNGFVSRQVHRWHPDVKNHTKEGASTDWSLDN